MRVGDVITFQDGDERCQGTIIQLHPMGVTVDEPLSNGTTLQRYVDNAAIGAASVDVTTDQHGWARAFTKAGQ
jgi:hypothetical protein